MRGLVLITYRDRPTHLSCLTKHLAEYYPQLEMVVVEQADTAVWNKGLLYNAGVTEFSSTFDYFILHDVDWIPVVGEVDYSPTELPTMIGARASQFNYKLLYKTFFGGVVVLSKEHYYAVNGFSNKFRGYGGEDDFLYKSFIEKGITPGVKDGKFECFHHPRPDIAGVYKLHPDYQNNLRLLKEPRDFLEGLSTAEYRILDIVKTPLYTHLKIKTD